MSRLTFALALLYFGLLLLAVHTMADSSSEPLNANNINIDEEQLQQQQRQQQQQQQQQKRDIDLNGELAANMEQQLQQANRLNRGDPTDRMQPGDGGDELQYTRSSAYQPVDRSHLLNGNTNKWLERVRLAARQQQQQQQQNQKQRRQASNRFVRALNDHYFNTGRTHNPTDLDGGSGANVAPLYLVEGQDEEDKDYAFINVPVPVAASGAASKQQHQYADNQESAARDSLWTSGQLRDLLIAQERRNRTRKLSNLLQAMARQRAAALSQRASASISSEMPAVEVAEIREKRRRCKVDPNLGVKNLSYCDTDAYFGAADYSMRDVWDSAGRRR